MDSLSFHSPNCTRLTAFVSLPRCKQTSISIISSGTETKRACAETTLGMQEPLEYYSRDIQRHGCTLSSPWFSCRCAVCKCRGAPPPRATQFRFHRHDARAPISLALGRIKYGVKVVAILSSMTRCSERGGSTYTHTHKSQPLPRKLVPKGAGAQPGCCGRRFYSARNRD